MKSFSYLGYWDSALWIESRKLGIYFMPVCHIVAHHSISNSLPNTDHLSLALINRS